MKRFVFETDCVSLDLKDVPDLQAMIDGAKEVTITTFRANCETRLWEIRLGYRRNRHYLTLSRDPHVRFYSSRWRGRPCFYAVHSAIEHIFTERT